MQARGIKTKPPSRKRKQNAEASENKTPVMCSFIEKNCWIILDCAESAKQPTSPYSSTSFPQTQHQ
jgi:hypothetical protein